MTGKCKHPKNYGKECDEGCPERNDLGISPLDIATAMVEGLDCEYIEGYIERRNLIKCEDCKQYGAENLCQITKFTEDPHGKRECKGFEES